MIALPTFLFLLIALGFWVITDSRLHLALRSTIVAVFFMFGFIFWQNTSSFLGWAANGEVLYGSPVTVFGVVINEPTKESKGGIYATVSQPPSIYKSAVLRIFGHPIQAHHPRLYRFDYNREMHKQIEQKIVKRLQQGQRGVRGTFQDPNGEKGDSKGKGKGDGKGKGQKGKGEGSQSHESPTDYFNNMAPSHEYDKARPENKPARNPLVI